MRLYHSTGREYNGEQELVIDILSIKKDEEIDGFWDFTAVFTDNSRSIRGKIENVIYTNTDFPADIVICEAVLNCYDNNYYREI